MKMEMRSWYMTRGNFLTPLMNGGWETILDEVSQEDYFSISQAFIAGAEEAETNCEPIQSEVLNLMAAACGMMITSDSPNDPFGPWWEGGGRRSAIPDDFTEAQIDFIAEAVDLIDNPLIKGRLADLVWHVRRPRQIEVCLGRN